MSQLNNMTSNDNIDVPIETQEQAQLLEQQFRDQAIAAMYSKYVVLQGIRSPADVTEDLECEECGAPVPAARVRALMAEVNTPNGPIWKANPSAKLCIDCASTNASHSRFRQNTTRA